MSVVSTICVMVSSLIQNVSKKNVTTDDKVVVTQSQENLPADVLHDDLVSSHSVKMISDLQPVSTEQDLGQVVEHLPPHGLVAVHVPGVAEHGLQHLPVLGHSS